MKARAPILLLAVLLQACVYVPRATMVYDEQCRVERRHLTLEPQQLGAFGHCANEGCAYLLVAAGAVAAASLVVSGSIVVVGNAVYWLEKQGTCPSGRWWFWS